MSGKTKLIGEEFLTLREIYHKAKKILKPAVFDYFAGGADSETTLRRNQEAIGHFEFRPRMLRDVSAIDTKTTFLGIPLTIPVMVAPMASLGLIHRQADILMARAAARIGTLHWLSTRTSLALEDVIASAPDSLIFQLYWRGDNKWCEDLIDRIETLGFKALALTVDAPMYGRRERDLHNRFNHRTLPRSIKMPMDRSLREATLTWKDVSWLRRKTKLPLILKGIQTTEDAKLAVEHGIDCIYVSNHGGRQLDFAVPAIEILAEIAGVVKKRSEIIVDSGFERGSDVLKALALGAKAVLIGKLATWGLAVGGEKGVLRTLELLKLELITTMANIGCKSISEVKPYFLRQTCFRPDKDFLQ